MELRFFTSVPTLFETAGRKKRKKEAEIVISSRGSREEEKDDEARTSEGRKK